MTSSQPSSPVLHENGRFTDLVLRGEDLSSHSFADCGFGNCLFENCSLAGADLANCLFENCTFSDCTATDATLTRCTFARCRFAAADFSLSSFTDCLFEACSFEKTALTRVPFSGCAFAAAPAPGSREASRPVRSSCVWSGCECTGATFLSCLAMKGVLFADCAIDGLYVRKTDLDGLVLRGCKGSVVQIREGSLKGLHAQASELRQLVCTELAMPESSFVECSLDHACFSASDLRGSTLANCSTEGLVCQGTILEGASLAGLNLDRAQFAGARMRAASLKGSSCRMADFAHADLSLADLSGCDFTLASFHAATLAGANLDGTVQEGVRLTDRDRLRAENFRPPQGPVDDVRP